MKTASNSFEIRRPTLTAKYTMPLGKSLNEATDENVNCFFAINVRLLCNI